MPTNKSSGEGTAKKKAAVKRPARKLAPRKQAAETIASPAAAVKVAEDRLKGVARSIGSTVGGLVAKTKKVLKRGNEQK